MTTEAQRLRDVECVRWTMEMCKAKKRQYKITMIIDFRKNIETRWIANASIHSDVFFFCRQFSFLLINGASTRLNPALLLLFFLLLSHCRHSFRQFLPNFLHPLYMDLSISRTLSARQKKFTTTTKNTNNAETIGHQENFNDSNDDNDDSSGHCL